MSGQVSKRIAARRRRAAELRAQGLSQRQSAAQLGVDQMTVQRDLVEWDRTRPNRTAQVKQNRAENASPILGGNGRWELRLGDFRDTLDDLEPGTVDVMVTDPPYLAEHLPLWSDLAEHAAGWLKPGGLLAAMSGQFRLPEAMTRLGEHLTYHWTLAYLTPGGQAVQVFPRKVSTFWKPVLVYRNDGRGDHEWFGDVARSDVNHNDRRQIGGAGRTWAQSESGMTDLLRRLSRPDDLVLDPFAGSGTTGVAARMLGRRFLGCEISPVDHAIATARLSDLP